MTEDKLRELHDSIAKKDLKRFLALLEGEKGKQLDQMLPAKKASIAYLHRTLTLLGHASRGRLTMVKALIERGADPNAGRGTLPVHEALCHGGKDSARILEVLIAAGADPKGTVDNKSDLGPRTAIECYFDQAKKENVAGFRVLLEAGCPATGGFPKRKGVIPLSSFQQAVQRGWHDTVELMLAHGAKRNVGKDEGHWGTFNPLQFAVRKKDQRMVQILATGKHPASTKLLSKDELADYKRLLG